MLFWVGFAEEDEGAYVFFTILPCVVGITLFGSFPLTYDSYNANQEMEIK